MRICIFCLVLIAGCARRHVGATDGGATRDGRVPADNSSVGGACMPENVPEGGFRAGDHHLETSSVQCPERVCAVYGLEGDPSDGCTENCASPPEVEERVFCTCRCDSVFDDDDFCDCPSDFTCAPVGEQGDSYCVRDSLVD